MTVKAAHIREDDAPAARMRQGHRQGYLRLRATDRKKPKISFLADEDLYLAKESPCPRSLHEKYLSENGKGLGPRHSASFIWMQKLPGSYETPLLHWNVQWYFSVRARCQNNGLVFEALQAAIRWLEMGINVDGLKGA